jgi:hypothetical protein
LQKQIASKEKEILNLDVDKETAMADIKHIKKNVRHPGFGLATLASHNKNDSLGISMIFEDIFTELDKDKALIFQEFGQNYEIFL